MQNLGKVFAAACRHVREDEELQRILDLVARRLTVFMQSVHIEVQERATTFRNLLVALGVLPPDSSRGGAEGQEGGAEEPLNLLASTVQEGVSAARLNVAQLQALSAETVQPVNPKAQRKVPVPEGLDLEAALDGRALEDLQAFTGFAGKPPELSHVCFTHVYLAAEPEDEPLESMFGLGLGGSASNTPARAGYEEAPGDGGPYHSQEGPGTYQTGDIAEAQRAKWQATPFYLGGSTMAATPAAVDEGDLDAIPIIRLTAKDLEGRRGKRDKKGGRKGKGRGRAAEGAAPMGVPVLRDEVMPEGAVDSGSEEERCVRGLAGWLAGWAGAGHV
jgi:hypothetical protein